MRVTVEQVQKWLEQFPKDAFCYGYEGEGGQSIVVQSADQQRELGALQAEES